MTAVADSGGAARTGGAGRDQPGWLPTTLRWLPIALAVGAEAAWITIVAGLVQEFSLRPPVIGLGGMIAFVAVGTLSARAAARRGAARSWPVLALGIVAVAAVGGWLWSADARAAAAAFDLPAALAANPGGFAAGLAVLRGFAHGGDHLGVDTIARMLFAGLPGLGLLAAIGGMIVDPWRSQFLADAAIGAVVFTACGLLALAFAGVAEIERTGLPTWRQNPTWVGLLLVAVAALVAVAIPIAALAGSTIILTLELIFGVALVPLVVAGLLYGSGAGLRRLIAITAFGIGIVWILSLLAGRDRAAAPGAAGGGSAGLGAGALDQTSIIALGTLVLGLVAIGIVILVRAWARGRGPRESADEGEERSFDLPEPEALAAGRGLARRRRPGQPTSAAEAYLHLVADLEARPDARREPDETPAEHARRLRRTGEAAVADGTALRLSLLAADYGLERYGGARLSGAETHRAIERWRSLRRRIGRGGRLAGPPPLGKEDAVEPGLPLRTGPGPISATDDERFS